MLRQKRPLRAILSDTGQRSPRFPPHHSRRGEQGRWRDARDPQRVGPHPSRGGLPVDLVARQHHARHLSLRDVRWSVEHGREHRVEQTYAGP
jgi:hypothetical protein